MRRALRAAVLGLFAWAACAPSPLEIVADGAAPHVAAGVLAVQLEGWPEALSTATLEGGRQSVVGDVVRVQHRSEPLALRVAEIEASAWSEALECDTRCGDPALAGLVEDVASAGEGARARAVRAVRIIAEEVQPERVVRPQTPAVTWQRKRGDCTEMSELAVAALRRAEVPARMVSGLAWIEGAWRPHAWVEFAAGATPEEGWATADPAYGVVPAPLDRVRLFLWPAEGWEALREGDGLGLRVRAVDAALAAEEEN